MITDAEVTITREALNDLSKEIGQWAESKGFREDWELADDLELWSSALSGSDTGNTVLKIIGDDEYTVCDMMAKAANVLRTNIIGTKLMLIVTELSEAMESLRDNGADGVLNGEGNVGEELADALIRTADLAHQIRSLLGDEVMTKVEKNVHRPHKHGRKL